MVIASQLRAGMVIKVGPDVFKVIEATYHVGQGKMPGSVHAKVQSVSRGTSKELRFRPEERLEDLLLEKVEMEFLYSDADSVTFMHPTSYEQQTIALEAVGPAAKFLKPEMRIPVEFCEGQPVSIDFPAVVDVKVTTTAAPVHQQQDNTYKYATLENGMEVLVPQFIKVGELVRIDVASGKYVDRVRTDSRKW